MLGAVVVFAVLVAGTGCDAVYDLTRPPDAPIEPDAARPCDEITTNDEDGDDIRDGCDNCPTIDNTDQANTRETTNGEPADSLGDACDPNPTLTGDRIVRFYAFADPADASMFLASSGAWSIQDGAYRYVGDEFHSRTTLANQEASPEAPFTVETVIHLTSIPTGGYRGVGFELVPSIANQSTRCTIERPFETPTLPDRITAFAYPSQLVQNSLSALANAVTYRMIMNYDPDSTRCVAVDSDNVPHITTTSDFVPRPVTTISFMTEMVDAEFDYLIVYGTTPR